MKRNQLLYGILIIVLFVIFYNSFNSGESEREYIQRIIEERAAKDVFFESDSESPFPDSLTFNGLKYFPPSPEFKINAKFSKIVSPTLVSLATSDGKVRKYKEFGYAEFEFEGKTNRLLVLEMEEPYSDKLFIPFADETRTIETYGAGRYLEADKPEGKIIILDFNTAYNPYCAYSEEFSCPFPPRENLLSISINAGEKKYFEN